MEAVEDISFDEKYYPSDYGELAKDPKSVSFYWAYIVDSTNLDVILDDRSQLNIKAGESNYTLATKILMSEYEYYFAYLPYELLHKEQSINKEYQMVKNEKIEFYFPISKEDVIKMILNKELLIGVKDHFVNQGIIQNVEDPDEILEYYQDTNPNKIAKRYRWVRQDYLAV
jgi:hypothetical protein